MKSAIPFLFCLLLCASSAFSQSDKQVEQEIRRIHEEQRVAFLNKDIPTIKRTFSPDCIITNPFGQFINVEQLIERVKTGLIDFVTFERELDYVKVYGDTVIVAGRETMVPKGKMQGAGTIIKLRMTTVWKKQNGEWREIARHTSVLDSTEYKASQHPSK